MDPSVWFKRHQLLIQDVIDACRCRSCDSPPTTVLAAHGEWMATCKCGFAWGPTDYDAIAHWAQKHGNAPEMAPNRRLADPGSRRPYRRATAEEAEGIPLGMSAIIAGVPVVMGEAEPLNRKQAR